MTQPVTDPVYPPASELEITSSDYDLYKSFEALSRKAQPSVFVFGKQWYIMSMESRNGPLIPKFRVKLIEVVEVKK